MNHAAMKQLPQLVGPMRKILTDGVAELGFDPVAIAYSMMLAGMLAMREETGKTETCFALYAMINGLIEENGDCGETLQ